MKILNQKSLIFILYCMMTFQIYGQTDFIVDDFKTGNLPLLQQTTVGTATKTQAGSSIIKRTGETTGYRYTALIVTATAYNHPKSLTIGGGICALSSGYKSGARLELTYGVDANGVNKPLNFNASNYKNINIEFEGNNKVLNFVVHFKCCNGSLYTNKNPNNSDIAPSESPFIVSIPLNDFSIPIDKSNPSNKWSWSDIDFMSVICQPTGPTLGNDFAIKKIWFN